MFGQATGIHKRAESENLKKLFSAANIDPTERRIGSKPKITPIQKGGAPSKPDDQEEDASKHSKPKSRNISKSINLSTTLASLKAAASSTKRPAEQNPPPAANKPSPAKGTGSHFKQSRPLSSLDTIRRMESALPQFESAKVIVKDFGKVRAFAVNTHQGIVRSYNEDRVSILLNAQQR